MIAECRSVCQLPLILPKYSQRPVRRLNGEQTSFDTTNAVPVLVTTTTTAGLVSTEHFDGLCPACVTIVVYGDGRISLVLGIHFGCTLSAFSSNFIFRSRYLSLCIVRSETDSSIRQDDRRTRRDHVSINILWPTTTQNRRRRYRRLFNVYAEAARQSVSIAKTVYTRMRRSTDRRFERVEKTFRRTLSIN